MNNHKTHRDTEELMEEVYFKDQSVKAVCPVLKLRKTACVNS